MEKFRMSGVIIYLTLVIFVASTSLAYAQQKGNPPGPKGGPGAGGGNPPGPKGGPGGGNPPGPKGGPGQDKVPGPIGGPGKSNPPGPVGGPGQGKAWDNPPGPIGGPGQGNPPGPIGGPGHDNPPGPQGVLGTESDESKMEKAVVDKKWERAADANKDGIVDAVEIEQWKRGPGAGPKGGDK